MTLHDEYNFTYNLTISVANINDSFNTHIDYYILFISISTVAPTVSVSDATFEKNEPTRTVTCVPVGNPQSYTFYKWQHRSKYGVLIRELDGGQNGVLTLPSIPVENRYQDSGEYVCTADNGIVGRDGRIKQTGSGYVIINGM
jgi:hypothetical protein